MTVPGRLPIVQAPMAGGPSTPELAAATNAAGGFGYVAAGYLTPNALREVLDRTRALTGDPIGVNVFVPGSNDVDDAAIAAYARRLTPEAARLGVSLGEPRWEDDAYDAKLDLLERSGVHTVGFTFGAPTPTAVQQLHQAGITVAVTVTSRREAELAGAAGADVLVVQGTEAGGHQGTFDGLVANRTPLAEALAAAKSLELPMIAAGGIGMPRDVRTALDAGAVAVQIGTALLCTPEAGTSPLHRSALLSRRYDNTTITRAFSGRWARGLANRFALEHPDVPAGYPQIHHLTRPLRAAASTAGDSDVPNLWAGTGWREISERSAREVIQSLADEL